MSCQIDRGGLPSRERERVGPQQERAVAAPGNCEAFTRRRALLQSRVTWSSSFNAFRCVLDVDRLFVDV